MVDKFGGYVERLRAGETRKAVAERAGISAEYLRQIERLGKIPRQDKLLALAKALDQEPKEFLYRALEERNDEAARALQSVRPRFPRLRQTLLDRLRGQGRDLVAEDLVSLELAPQERLALLVWAGIHLMDVEGLEPEAARARAKQLLGRPEFVDETLADYVARNIVAWEVDPQTGQQTYQVASARVEEILEQMVEFLFPAGGSINGKNAALAREIAELLEDEEFAALFHNLKSYRKLSERDKSDIRSLWEIAGTMVKERLGRAQSREVA